MKVLVAPLNWGIGHATRCVPLIRALMSRGHEVILGADGKSLELLQGESPELVCRRFPDLNIRYARSRGGFWLVMLRQLPKIMYNIRRENRMLKKWVREFGIEVVISDNRYGMHDSKCRCYLMTHQLHIILRGDEEGAGQSGLPERLLSKLLVRRLSRFREVWVPDYGEQPNLAGNLSMPLPGVNTRYIGPLSRLSARGGTSPSSPEAPIKVLALLSGPEPQRSLFEEKIKFQLRHIPGPHVMVTGALNGREPVRDGEITLYGHAGAEDLVRWMGSAETVIARSGYSTIMDLACLGAQRVLFVPTPGQTEQEYLSSHLQQLQIAPFRRQETLELAQLNLGLKGYSGFAEFKGRPGDLESALDGLEEGLEAKASPKIDTKKWPDVAP